MVLSQYSIARLALLALTLVATIVLFFYSLRLAARRKDPARTAFTYLKAAVAVFAVFHCFDICSYVFVVIDYETYLLIPYQAETYLAALSALLDCFSDTLTLVILLRISTGIIIVQSGEAGKIGKILKIASYGAAVVLVAISLAHFVVEVLHMDSEYPLFVTFHVLVFVAAILVAAGAIKVKLQARSEQRVAMASNLLIACSGLWLLRTAYRIIVIAIPEYCGVCILLDVFLAIWPILIILCIVLAIGAKKQNGLWSTDQPFMMVNAADQQSPSDITYKDPQNCVQPMVEQQPPTQAGMQPEQQGYYQPQLQQHLQLQHPRYPQELFSPPPELFAPLQHSLQQHQQPPQELFTPPPELFAPSQNSPQQQRSSNHYDPSSTISPATAAPPPLEDAGHLNHGAYSAQHGILSRGLSTQPCPRCSGVNLGNQQAGTYTATDRPLASGHLGRPG